MEASCTLVLTQGVHVIDEPSAIAVERALEEGARSVQVGLDMTGSGNVRSQARISTAHVIAVIRHPAQQDAFDVPPVPNVHALRRR